MINKLLNFKVLLLLIGILLLVSGFYWFQWRPSEIRIQCENEMWEEINERRGTSKALEFDGADWYYKNCLRDKGLK